MSRAAAVALLVALSVPLAGCAVIDQGREAIGIVSREVARQVALSELGESLRKMDGIDTSDGYYSSTTADGIFVGTTVVAKQASDEQLIAIAEVVRAAFSSELFSDTTTQLTVDLGDGSRLEQLTFVATAGALAEDIEYWRAVERVLETPLTMWVLPEDIGMAGDYEYVRELNAVGPDHALTTARFIEVFEELREIKEPSTAATLWSLPGLYASPGLPPEHVVSLLSAVTAAAVPADIAEWQMAEEGAELDGSYVWWDGDAPDELTIEFLHPGESQMPLPEVVTLAESLAATQVLGFHLFISESDDGYGKYVFFGTCAGIPDVYGPDSDAYAELVQASTALGPLGPGWCNKFAA